MIASQAIARAAILTDQDGRIVTWNAASEALFGQAAKAVLGQPLVSLLTLEAGHQCLADWPHLPLENSTVRIKIKAAGARSRAALLTLVPQTNGAGQPAGCVASFATLVEQRLSDAMVVGQTPLANIVGALAGTFYVINGAGRFVLWNSRLEEVVGMTPEQLRGANAVDMFDPADRPAVAEKIREVFEEGTEVVVEARYVGRHGARTPYLTCCTRVACRGVYYLCAMGLNTSQRHAQEGQLRLRERALHAASNGIVIARCNGADTPIEYVNPAFERISGYSAEEVLGRDSRFMGAPGLDNDERARLRAAVLARRGERVVFRNCRKNGEIFWNELAITPVHDEYGAVTHFIGIINDVTASKQRTDDLEHEVNHDALTGLASRNLMWDRLEQALHLALRNKTMVATVLVDLDGFKQINDTHGHEAGDEVLVAVARRLQSAVRDVDTVARLSGDEFVLILTNQPSLRFTVNMAERLRQSLAQPVLFDGTEIAVSASMGAAIYPHDGTTPFELVRAADAAMYHTKARGKGDLYFFSEDMKSSSDARQRMEAQLRVALERDELVVLFQPRYCMRSGRLLALEALVRWRHPEHGMLLPAEFLPDAEENGLILPIGERVLDGACHLLDELRQRRLDDVAVSLNASYREYSQPGYVARLGERLNAFQLPPRCLEVEFREDDLVRNLDLGGVIADDMARLGTRMAIDHFGEGITSLGYLHRYRAAHIKLNQQAVRGVGHGGEPEALVKTLIDIGHDLHIGVVAQGIETADQLSFLKANGCDEMQGRYVSDPLSRESLRRLLGVQAR